MRIRNLITINFVHFSVEKVTRNLQIQMKNFTKTEHLFLQGFKFLIDYRRKYAKKQIAQEFIKCLE